VGFCGSIFPLIYEICVKKVHKSSESPMETVSCCSLAFLADGTEAGSIFHCLLQFTAQKVTGIKNISCLFDQNSSKKANRLFMKHAKLAFI